jgi:hypothetical protein
MILKLKWPITKSLCVPCTTTWKHLASSVWMNVADFIFQLFHIRSLPTLSVLNPFRLPCTPYADYAHLYIDHGKTSNDYNDFSVDYAHLSTDRENTFGHYTITIYIWSLHPKSCNAIIILHLQIENKDCVHSWICDLFFYLHPFSYVVSVFHILHPLPWCQNLPPKLHLHSVPNILASVIILYEL